MCERYQVLKLKGREDQTAARVIHFRGEYVAIVRHSSCPATHSTTTRALIEDIDQPVSRKNK